MILYFTGTGNSAYAARRIGATIQDSVLNLFEKIRSHDFSALHSDRPWVIVVPTYAWRIPRIVEHWLTQTTLTGSQDIYFVMTCGGSIGNAGKYLQQLCKVKGLHYLGCMPVVMPENYIALYAAPPQTEARQIIQKADSVLASAADLLKTGAAFPAPAVTWKGKFRSSVENAGFYPLYVHAKKFYATDKCISCEKCVQVCPLHNVRLENGKPVWGTQCTHCMACICHCPVEAIEYGEHTRGALRYRCEQIVPGDWDTAL